VLVETAIETGLRWGELAELRVKDIDLSRGLLTVSRSVVALSRKYHPEARRFFTKEYPKDREWRRFRLSDQVARKLAAHVATYQLGANDLLFARRGALGPHPRVTALPDPGTPGLTMRR
jgi:integrase